MFAGILGGMILVYNVALALTLAGGILSVIGGMVTLFCGMLYWLVLPVCLFKIVKGMVILGIDRQNRIGKWAVRKFSLPNYTSEIQKCQEYIQRYTIVEENLEKWREDLLDGIIVDTSFVRMHMENLELEPEIPAVNHNFGKLQRFYLIASILITVILYIFIHILF